MSTGSCWPTSPASSNRPSPREPRSAGIPTLSSSTPSPAPSTTGAISVTSRSDAANHTQPHFSAPPRFPLPSRRMNACLLRCVRTSSVSCVRRPKLTRWGVLSIWRRGSRDDSHALAWAVRLKLARRHVSRNCVSVHVALQRWSCCAFRTVPRPCVSRITTPAMIKCLRTVPAV